MLMKRFKHNGSGSCRPPRTVPANLGMTTVCVHLALLAVAAAYLGAADPTTVAYERDIKPLLSTYCFKCHGPDKHKGDLNLSAIANDDAARHAVKIWRKVLDRMRVRDMPPEEAPQPTAAEAERLKAGIAILKRPLGPPDPGQVTIRRLNRKEYDNTIHDLIGLDLKSSADFPADDVGDGFDNIGDVLTLSPILLEKYLDAADKALDKAIVDEQVNLKLTGEQLPALIEGKPVDANADGKGRVFTAIGESYLDVAAPNDGKYAIKIKAGGEQAGSEPVRMLIKVGNEVVKEFKITATRTSPATVSATLSLVKGANHVAVCFANPFTEAAMSTTAPPSAPKPSTAGAAKAPDRRPGRAGGSASAAAERHPEAHHDRQARTRDGQARGGEDHHRAFRHARLPGAGDQGQARPPDGAVRPRRQAG
jgi:hypothetical protein